MASKFRLTPRENANVTQSELVSNQVRRLAGGDVVDLALRRETVVEHLVQALGLGLVAVDGVGEFFGGIWVDVLVGLLGCHFLGFGLERTSEEVVCLALHGADATLL